MSDSENWDPWEMNDEEGPPQLGLVGTSEEQNEQSTTSENNSDHEVIEGPFDTNLPTEHKYLGKLNNVSGYTLYDEGEILKILAICTNTLVFPGFTLPLVINNHDENNILQNYIKKNSVFVLLCANYADNCIFNYGVTMEIFETQIRNQVLNIKARGRQRCKLMPGESLRMVNAMDRIQEVMVKILAEPQITSPIANSQFLTLKAKRKFIPKDYRELVKNYKYRRQHCAQYPLANWVYDKYETCYYAKLLLEGLKSYVGECIPNDPTKLSYWFVQNYQLNHEERLNILALDNTLQRLRLEYKYLKMERNICCDNCGTEITDPSKVFAMSKDGIQSNYVNPGGHVYETVTVTAARNYHLIGVPSKEFSWFPGYYWTILQCQVCRNHLGWRFTSQSLRPSCFFGLAKTGFKVVTIADPEDEAV